jgi:hypothetical protein
MATAAATPAELSKKRCVGLAASMFLHFWRGKAPDFPPA